MPSLEITTKLGCSLACTFCPQGALAKTYPRGADRFLSFDNFAHVLTKLPRHVRIDFSGMSEPWLNPEATRMVKHSFEDGRRVAIYTTLEGMSPKEGAELLRLYGDRITPATPWLIHLPDDEKNMAGWRISDAYRDTLAIFVDHKRKHPKSLLKFMTMSGTGRVAPEISSIVGNVLRPFHGISRAENLRRSDLPKNSLPPKVEHKDAVVCRSTPFFDHNCLLPNGDVVLCCMDYSMEAIIGNLFEQTYEEIFQAKPMADVRLKAMTPCADPSFICKRCDNAAPVSLDENDADWHLSGDTFWTKKKGLFKWRSGI